MVRLKFNIILTCCLIIIYGFIEVSTAYANTFSISVSPTVFKIRALQPSKISLPFTVSNNSSKLINLQLETRFFRDAGKDDGSIIYINQSDSKSSNSYQDITRNIKILDGDHSITYLSLGPKEKKHL